MRLDGTIDLEIKLAGGSGGAGEIAGYASLFDAEADDYGDTIAPGAFAASLAEHKAAGTMPLMLWQHDIAEPIGVWTEIKEDANGLSVSGRIILSTRRGAEAYALLKEGALDGLSIGFRTRRWENVDGGGRRLLEIELVEISIVSVPAAHGARVANVKQREEGNMPKPVIKEEGGDGAALETRASELESRADRVDERLGAVETVLDEIRETAESIETRLSRPGAIARPAGEGEDAAAIEKRAFGNFLRRGAEHMGPDEVKSLKVADDTTGGYLAPPQFVAEVIKGIVEISPVRQAARVGQTAAGSVILPRRTGQPTAQWVGETETRAETEAAYGQIEIPTHEASCYVDVSRRLLEDSAVNVEAEVAADLAEEFGRLEGAAFVLGDGVKKPTGFLTNKNIAFSKTGSTTSLGTAPDETLINLMYALPAFYRATGVWMMNASTIAVVRLLKDSNGRFLWQNSLQDGQPDLLLGRPVIEAPDMEDIGSNKVPVIFGNFQRGYRVYDRLALSVLRDPYTVANKGLVRYHARRRVGGDVVLSEAFRKLKCAT